MLGIFESNKIKTESVNENICDVKMCYLHFIYYWRNILIENETTIIFVLFVNMCTVFLISAYAEKSAYRSIFF